MRGPLPARHGRPPRSHQHPAGAGTGGLTRRGDHTVAYSPVWDFTDQEIHGYLARHRIPVNPIYREFADMQALPYLQQVGLLVDVNNAA